MHINSKSLLKVAIGAFIFFDISLLAYAAYVYGTNRRIGDQTLPRPNTASFPPIPKGKSIRIATWNTGYGAYSNDYTFFMDGGKESRARSVAEVEKHIAGIALVLEDERVDIALLQEVDTDGDRSCHVDEWAYYTKRFSSFDNVYASNYDSPYLCWPPTDPIGKAKSGIGILSRYAIGESRRVSLPISGGFKKVVDLDRCYTVSTFRTESGKNLYIYNVHLTAYGGGDDIARAQIAMLAQDIGSRLAQGDEIICGGDFNHDLPTDSVERFNGKTKAFGWCKPFLHDLLPEGVRYIAPQNPSVATSRLLDKPYVKGSSFVATIDGFFASSGIEILNCRHISEEFQNTDHNPVILDFKI